LKTTVQKCAALCCIYSTRQTGWNANFKNEFCNCTDFEKGRFHY